MIHPQILAFTEKFEQEMRAMFARFPIFQLDRSWPSVGTLDLMLFHLRGKADLDDSQASLLQASACYLGVILHNTWSEFNDGSQPTLGLESESGSEILLSLKGGKYLSKDAEVRISLSATLSAIFRELPNPLPIFEGYRMQASMFENLLSPVAGGIASTLTPYADGPLATKRIYEITPYILTAQRVFSESTARQFKNLFAGDAALHDPALFLSNLIFPPAGYDEKFPGSRASVALAEYLLAADMPTEHMQRMAFALANSPDSLISTAGFAVSVALLQKEAPASLIALSESKRVPIHRLRPAVVAARRALGLPHDWTLLLEDEDLEPATRLAMIEHRLGLLPLLQCPARSIADKRLHGMFHALAWGDLERGVREGYQAVQATQFDPTVALQAIQFDMAQGSFDSASDGINAILKKHPGDDDVQHRAHRMRAQSAIYAQDWVTARDSLIEALIPDSVARMDRASTLNELAYIHLVIGDPQLCVEAASESLVLEPYHLPQRLNRIAALQMLEQDDAAYQEVEALSRYNATDPRIFELIRTIICTREVETKH